MPPEDFLGDRMVWFVIAALANPVMETVDFKINNQMIFNTEKECVEYLNTYDQFVKAGIKRSFPDLNLLDIRCIDKETAQAMIEQMRSSK